MLSLGTYSAISEFPCLSVKFLVVCNCGDSVNCIAHVNDAAVMDAQCSVVAEADCASGHFSAAAAQHHSALSALSSAAQQSHPGTDQQLHNFSVTLFEEPEQLVDKMACETEMEVNTVVVDFSSVTVALRRF